MDDENETTTLLGNKIKDALSGVPEEVQTFMWSDDYKIIIDTIQKTLLLTDQEKNLVKYGGYELLLEMKTMEEVAKEWIAAGMKPELVVKVLYVIHQEILTRAQNITEFFTRDPNATSDEYAEVSNEDDNADEEPGTEPSIPPTVSDQTKPIAPGLSSLADRLKQTSIATPMKRDYTATAETSSVENTPPSPHAIDPYHESIDNE